MLVISLNIPEFRRVLDPAAICDAIVAMFAGAVVTDHDANETERLQIEAALEQLARDGHPHRWPDVVWGSFQNRLIAFGKCKRLSIPLSDNRWFSGRVNEAHAIFCADAAEHEPAIQVLIEYLRSLEHGAVSIGESTTQL